VFDRSSELSLILKSVLLLISRIATSKALWRKFAQIGKRRFLNNVPVRILDRFQTENLSKAPRFLPVSLNSWADFSLNFGCRTVLSSDRHQRSQQNHTAAHGVPSDTLA
jgi:hypothetical protein